MFWWTIGGYGLTCVYLQNNPWLQSADPFTVHNQLPSLIILGQTTPRWVRKVGAVKALGQDLPAATTWSKPGGTEMLRMNAALVAMAWCSMFQVVSTNRRNGASVAGVRRGTLTEICRRIAATVDHARPRRRGIETVGEAEAATERGGAIGSCLCIALFVWHHFTFPVDVMLRALLSPYACLSSQAMLLKLGCRSGPPAKLKCHAVPWCNGPRPLVLVLGINSAVQYLIPAFYCLRIPQHQPNFYYHDNYQPIRLRCRRRRYCPLVD